MRIVDKINRKIDELRKRRNEIPHVKAGIESVEREVSIEKENEKLRGEVDRLEKESKKVKINKRKFRKKEKSYKKEVKKLNRKVTECRGDKKEYINKLNRNEKKRENLSKNMDNLMDKKKELEQELVEYKGIVRESKRNKTHVPDLTKRIDELEKQLREHQEEHNEVVYGYVVKIKKLKDAARGYTKALEKKNGEIEELESKNGVLRGRLGNVKNIKDDLENKLEKEKLKVTKLKTDKMSVGNVRKYVRKLEERITVDNVEDFSFLEGLYDKYEDIKRKREELYRIQNVIYGYIEVENKKVYVIDVEDGKSYSVTGLGGYSVRDGLVVKVEKYEDGQAVIKRTYENRYGYESKKEEKEVNKVKTERKKGNINKKYRGDLTGLNVLMLTGKQMNTYRKYFGERVNIVDPFEKEKAVLSEIEKADIVLMRMDAVPHSVSGYVKEHCKERVVYLYKDGLLEVGNKLFNKVMEQHNKTG